MLRAELAAAAMLLTRLPVSRLAGDAPPADPAASVWAYPVVGVAVGAIGAITFVLCARAGLPPALAAAWTLAALLLATGALHEDGLADTADGFGGGSSRARKLEIMRDSRIGSYGAAALLLSLAIRGAAIAALARPQSVAAALIASAALARGALAIPLLTLPPARPDGLAAGLRAPPLLRTLLAPALAAAVALLCLPLGPALAALLAAPAVAAAFSLLARRQIGGSTGDVLGACVVTAECVVLSLLAATWRG